MKALILAGDASHHPKLKCDIDESDNDLDLTWRIHIALPTQVMVGSEEFSNFADAKVPRFASVVAEKSLWLNEHDLEKLGEWVAKAQKVIKKKKRRLKK